MGNTGNTTGKHTHVEIREFQNGIAIKKLNPALYMGVPNKIGTYSSDNYQISTQGILKTLASNTNLRNAPTTKGTNATLYLANTTLYVLEEGVASADGYTWDKVKIRVNGNEGYMINKNYK